MYRIILPNGISIESYVPLKTKLDENGIKWDYVRPYTAKDLKKFNAFLSENKIKLDNFTYNFLLEMNAGVPEYDCLSRHVKIKNNKYESILTFGQMISINETCELSDDDQDGVILTVYQAYDKLKRIHFEGNNVEKINIWKKHTFLPIALSYYLNDIFALVDNGSVWLFEDSAIFSDKKCHKIADSFKEFIHRLLFVK